MDDEQIKKQFATLSEQFLVFNNQLIKLRASVHVLKVFEAMRLSPVDPVEGLKFLRQLEEKQKERDPQAQELKEVLELMKEWKSRKKTGGGGSSYEA